VHGNIYNNERINMQGWVKLHRGFTDFEWYKDANTTRVFLHLLITANHRQAKWQGNVIHRGQLITSRDHLAEDLGLSVQSVRTSLLKLKKSENITIKSTNRFTVISICNYDTYQSKGDDANQPTNQQLTNNQPTINQQSTTNKNDKNEKKGVVLEVNCDEAKRKLIFKDAKGYFNGLDYDNSWDKFTWVCEKNNWKRTEERWTKYINKK